MSVQRVTLTSSEEKYAPSEHEIDISVIGNDVVITVYEGSLEDLNKGRKVAFEVPTLDYRDLLRSLNAFSDVFGPTGRFVRPESPAAVLAGQEGKPYG